MKDFVSSFVSSLANTPPAKINMSSHVITKTICLIALALTTSLRIYADEKVLFETDFSDAIWSGVSFLQGNTTNYDVINGITFNSKSSSNQFSISNGKLKFPGSNISSSNYYLGFPVTGINEGTITIYIYDGENRTQVKYIVKNNESAFSSSLGNSGTATTAATPTTVTINSLDTKAYIYLGRSSSSYTTISKIVVTTPSNGGETSPKTYTLSSAVQPAGKAEVILDNTELQTDATATATYSIIDNDYEFDSWSISEGATIDSPYADPVTITMGSAPATITLNLKRKSSTGGENPTPTPSGETESTPTSVPGSNNDIEGVSYIIKGTFNAGQGGTQVGEMTSKGVKFRTNRNATTDDKTNAIEFIVKECYKITGITLVGVTNTDNKNATIGSIYVDGIQYTEPFDGNLPARNATKASNIVVSGISATNAIIFVFSDLNGTTQANIDYTITYEYTCSTPDPDEPTLYTVIFNYNGGTGSIQSLTQESENAKITLPAPEEREGYDFLGWFTAAENEDFVGQAYGTYQPKTDITLYAHWQQTGGNEPTPNPDGEGQCLKVSVTSGAKETFTDGTVLYSIDSNGRTVDTGGTAANFKSDKIDGSTTGACLSGQRFAIKIPYDITKLVIYGYSSGSGKTIRSVGTSVTAEKDAYSEVSCETNVTTESPNYSYTFTIDFNSPIPANTYIRVELSGSVNIHDLCYTLASQDPVTYVSLEPDKETVYEGCPVTITATATPDATEYEWEIININGVVQNGKTGATLTFTPDVVGTYKVVCKARNQYNDDWIKGEIPIEVKSLCGEQLIKVTVSGGKAGAIEGVVGGTADVDLSTSKNTENKLDDGKSLGITLAYGSFKEGDRVNINISKAADLGRIVLYADKAMSTTVYEGSDYGIEGDNQITLPQTAEGLTSLWIVRNKNINDNNWNPTINFVSVERLCGPYVSIVSSKPQIGCDGVTLSFEIYNAQDDITNRQWSLNGNVITGANTDTYQATVAGTYSVEVTLADGTVVTASLTLTTESVIETLVPKLTYQFAAMRGTENNEDGAIDNNKNRPYTSDDKYPLFSVAPAANGKNQWKATVEIHKKDKNGEVCYTSTTSTTYQWIEEYEIAEDNTITLVANYAALRDYIINESLWQILEGDALASDCDNHILRTGDTIMVKVAVEDCPFSERQVPIVISDKYSLAYIIRGNVDGDFYNDLYAPDTNDKFYQTLSERYEVTQVNAYAPFRKLNYAPFDIVVLSDYPKATGSEKATDPMERQYPDQMGALAQLVDYKPLFSLKGFLSALSEWKELGLMGNPRAPKTVTEMTVLCEHRVLGTSGSETETGDRKIKMLLGGADNKGLQGFLVEGLQNFIPIAVIDTINDNGQIVEGALIACCERQIKTEARMIILSIYSGAMDKLTDDGENAIYEIVDYLLDARPAKVEDCAYIFNGGPEGNNTSWKDPQNWATGSVPQSYNTIRIEAPCEIDDNIEAVSVRINNTNGSLTIAPNGALKVTDKFYMYDGADNYDKLLSVTDPDLITIKADATGNGMLIHTHNDAHPLYATVQLYSAAHYESDYTSESTATKYWTYFGVPVKEVNIPENFLYAYTYLWSESEGWIRKADGKVLYPFLGYALSQANAKTFELKGQLASTDSVAIKLTKTSTEQGGQDGMNLVGNSWTAPIHISQMTNADFGDAEKTIYIYQTGRDPNNGPAVGDGQNKGSDGYWWAIPVNASAVIAPEADEYDIPTVIPAMQAFEINTPKNTELHLVYDRIVRNQPTEQYNNAPRRVAANRNNPLLMRIRVEDSNTAATLYLLEDDSFTEGFDNGWDGRYMGNDGRTAGLWAYSAEGDMSVMAQPKIDGTTLGFKAGRENYYTFSFKWNGSPLWLNDIMLQRSVAIEQGSTYTFRASDTDPANRFCISSEPYSGGTETSLSDIVLTDGVLSVNNPTGEKLTLSVYDATGRLCSRTISTDHLLTTDIADVCQGVYMISVEGENTNIVKKVIR